MLRIRNVINLNAFWVYLLRLLNCSTARLLIEVVVRTHNFELVILMKTNYVLLLQNTQN